MPEDNKKSHIPTNRSLEEIIREDQLVADAYLNITEGICYLLYYKRLLLQFLTAFQYCNILLIVNVNFPHCRCPVPIDTAGEMLKIYYRFF